MERWTRSLRLSRISLLLVTAGTCTASAAPAAEPIDEQIAARIDAIATQALSGPGAAGLSIAVAQGSEIYEKGFGLANIEHDVPMTARSMLRIGSVTKQYTAALILKLVEEERLSLDDPLTKYIEYPVGEHLVTIRHLLNHTSGIPSYTSIEEFWSKHASRDLTDDEMLALVRDRPFDFVPGEEFRYNNTGYFMLGMVIESVTGQSYKDALEQHLLHPLGLRETRYDVAAEIVPHRASGYTIVEGSLANARPIGMRNPGAAGGLLATASDLIRWQQALVSGRVLSSESLELMIQPTVLADGSTEPYGFGIALSSRFERQCFSHGGGINGFNSVLLYFPQEELHVAVISNGEAVASGQAAMRIAAAMLGIEEEPIEDLAVPQEMLERISGQYRFEQIGLDIRFWADGDRLISQARGQPQIRLLHQGEGVFRAAFDPSLWVAFPVGDGEGAIESLTLEQGGMTLHGRRIDPKEAETAAHMDDLPVDEAMLKRMEGTYRLEQIGLEIRFWGSDGRLRAQAAAQPEFQLLYQGNGVFRAEIDATLRVTFPTGEETGDQQFTEMTFEQRGMSFQGSRIETKR